MTRYRMTPDEGKWRLYALKASDSPQEAKQFTLCTRHSPDSQRHVLRALQRLEARNG